MKRFKFLLEAWTKTRHLFRSLNPAHERNLPLFGSRHGAGSWSRCTGSRFMKLIIVAGKAGQERDHKGTPPERVAGWQATKEKI
jgi:hypothetical protein